MYAVSTLGSDYIITTGCGSKADASKRGELYKVEKNKWRALPEMGTGRYNHSMCTFKKQFVYVFAGYSFAQSNMAELPIEFLDLKRRKTQGWKVLELVKKRSRHLLGLPRLFMPASLQIS